MLSVSYYNRPVEALSERVPNQGSRCGMVPVDPTMDVIQQLLPLFDRDIALEDLSVVVLVELFLDDDKLLGAEREPPSQRLVRW